MLLLSIFVICLTVTSCKTISVDDKVIIFPSYPEKPVLTDNSYSNEVILTIHHYRWLLWAYTVEYNSNKIDKDEYKKKQEDIDNIILQLDAILKQL